MSLYPTITKPTYQVNKPLQTSASILGSCCKNKQWRELARDEGGHIVMRQMIDFGQQKSSRKLNKKIKRMSGNKCKIRLEFEKKQKTKPSK